MFTNKISNDNNPKITYSFFKRVNIDIIATTKWEMINNTKRTKKYYSEIPAVVCKTK